MIVAKDNEIQIILEDQVLGTVTELSGRVTALAAGDLTVTIVQNWWLVPIMLVRSISMNMMESMEAIW